MKQMVKDALLGRIGRAVFFKTIENSYKYYVVLYCKMRNIILLC